MTPNQLTDVIEKHLPAFQSQGFPTILQTNRPSDYSAIVTEYGELTFDYSDSYSDNEKGIVLLDQALLPIPEQMCADSEYREEAECWRQQELEAYLDSVSREMALDAGDLSSESQRR